MKKKIIFLGFLVCFLVILAVLPASAKTPTKPSSDKLCSVCEPTWWFLSDEDHAFYHCESTCQCSVKVCPACGNNSVAVYCYSSHNFKYMSGASGKSWGQTYTLTSKCADCSKQIVEECVYYEKSCYQGTYTLTNDPVVSPTCISRGYILTHCSQTWHTDCAAALGYSGCRYRNQTDAISEHSYSDLQHVSPTCTEAGGDLRSCSTCSLTIFENKVDALGHEYSSSITKEATCTDVGIKTFLCSKCSDSYTESISAIGHNYSLASTKLASCKEEGVLTYTCSNCSDSYTESLPMLSHVTATRAKFDDSGFVVYEVCNFCFEEIPVEDPCTDCIPFNYSCECGYGWKGEGGWNGLKFSASVSALGRLDYFDTCSDCGATFNFYLWAVHDYVRSVVDNSVYDICQNCEKSVFIKELDPDEGIDPGDCSHEYARITVSPSCLEHGYYTFVCTLCNNSYNDGHIDPLGHDPKTEVFSPTCIDEGYTRYTCPRCESSWISDLVPSLGHNFVNGFCTRCGRTEVCTHTFVERVVSPTCHDLGYTIYTCSLCGDIRKDNYIKQLEHDWLTVGSRNPSCDTAGYKQLKCSFCGESKIENISPYGHKWVAKGSVIQEDKQALVTFRCSTCGTVKTELLPTAAAQAQAWLLTVIGGVSSGIIDMYNTVANGAEVGGVTAGEVLSGFLVLIIVLGFLGFLWNRGVKK